MARVCRICRSEYCLEINELLKRGYSYADITRKYYPLFPGASFETFYQTVKTHYKDKHLPPIVAPTPRNVELEKGKPLQDGQTFETYSERLLRIGLSDEMMRPGKVSHSHIIAAERTKLEKEKLQLQVNAQKMLIIKFLRGLPEIKQVTLEGEEHEPNNLISSGSNTSIEENTD